MDVKMELEADNWMPLDGYSRKTVEPRDYKIQLDHERGSNKRKRTEPYIAPPPRTGESRHRDISVYDAAAGTRCLRQQLTKFSNPN
jgi:hypothetical protein